MIFIGGMHPWTTNIYKNMNALLGTRIFFWPLSFKIYDINDAYCWLKWDMEMGGHISSFLGFSKEIQFQENFNFRLTKTMYVEGNFFELQNVLKNKIKVIMIYNRYTFWFTLKK